MKYNLKQERWKLAAFDPYVPLQGNSMETGQELRGITPWIDCDVPGGVALAAYRAKLIDYPYYERNSLKCEWLENKWWMYETTFQRPALTGKRIRLVFDGVDYHAMIWLNGVLLGEHEGMYESFSFDITEQFFQSEELKLRVLIRHAPDEMGQIGHTSRTFTQKSRFNYKWDFSTRLVNLGIWQDAWLISDEEYGMEDLSVTSDADEKMGSLRIAGKIFSLGGKEEALTVHAEASLDGKMAAEADFPANSSFCGELTIPEPALWYPNGYGAQPLYRVLLELKGADGRVYDRKELNQGIRRLRYLQNEEAPDGALPYTFEVNGKKIYIKGVNLVPLDHIYGDLTPERVETTLRAAAGMNVNLVRIWGGGIIETETFYDLCDRYGLMVWQEFIQSSSGIDNIPSKRPEFLRLLEKTARSAVTNRRCHTSLTVWSGGNELMDKDNIPSTYEDPNIAMLKGIVEELDPNRMFLPTSASGPTEWQLAEPGKSHDIHGDWKYRGNPTQYETYSKNDNLFHSEFGCDGMSGMETVNRIFSPENRKPVSMEESPVWRFHGDWWCTWEREKTMFGEITEIEPYIAASQWMQAEGLRFILEANRRRAFHNSGSMIWQFNEPWPNVSCTCLYSYFDQPKMAYFWAKEAFSALHPSFDYRRLDYKPGDTLDGDVWLSADSTSDKSATISCKLFTMQGKLLSEKTDAVPVPDNRSAKCFGVSFSLPEEEGIYLLRVTAETDAGSVSTEYFFSTASGPVYAPARKLKPEISAVLTQQQGNRYTFTVTNHGADAALHVYPEEVSGSSILLPEEAYFTLLPGESRTISAAAYPRFRYGFDEFADAPAFAHVMEFRNF